MATMVRKVAVVGAGAVGSFYGAMLARAGHAVVLIGRPAHVDAIRRDGLRLEMAGKSESLTIDASSEIAAAHGADLVLVSVKSTDTEAVARELAPALARDAVVVSLQNGVENADVIARHVAATVVPAVVYVATAMPAPGIVRHHGRGDLVVGPRTRAAARDPALAGRLEAIASFFATAGVAVKVSADVVAELWSKLMVNCAYNAISALAQSSYGEMVALAPIRELQRTVVGEVVAVAAASGVELPLAAAVEAMERIAPAMPAQLSSTAQDVARGKPSEIDHLNGFVVRRGREVGIATPANQALHALVKLVESRQANA
ncbi:MAG TPA: ketopantoate reductase family protein [Caldimonas sp.]|jgi:2-dehydropantoate 2-reductase|nr:ketopantoate reductase family protein [Caldimonas sp.]